MSNKAAGFGDIYNTTDSMLATLLELCDCQHPKNELNQPFTCSNTYTPAGLAQMKDENGRPRYGAGNARGTRFTPDEAARDAHSKGIEGILIFHFEKSPAQQEICEGWESMLDALAEAKENNKANGQHEDKTVKMDELPISHKQIGRLVCALQNARKKMFDRVHRTRPQLALLEYNTQETGDRKTRFVGSGTIRSIKL